MEVKLVAYTQPTEEFAVKGVEDVQDLIAFCAKVSNPSGQFDLETSDRLIRYLVKHQHWSPLEMASATLEITTTRDIARQILRHRSFTFQEFSQRYADPTKDLDFVIREARLQDTKNRQNSIETDDFALTVWWTAEQQRIIELVQSTYKQAIERGIAKEQARAILPEGNTVSRMYVQGSIRSWVHYCELRKSNGTQKEHMEIAREIAKVIAKIFPIMDDVVCSGL
jgi:thymidylate synthase (FAD)